VLHPFKNKGLELTRKDLLDQLNLDMSDEELEKFTKEAEEYCREKGIACSEDEKWLGDSA
jgi:hypothetical protein